MLRRYRVLWAPLLWALLSVPLAIMLLAPDPAMVDRREMRPLATWPTLSDGHGGWKRIPARIDAYLADHFGLRGQMLALEALITQRLLRNGNPEVLIGHQGWLFYTAFESLQQSAGVLVRRGRVARTARIIDIAARQFAARGTRLIVAVPPASSTIYDAMLPAWARSRGRATEYDLLLAELAARGVPTLDLRPALRAAADRQVYFRHDTHWNPLGALLAFNGVAEAMGHAEWRLDPDTELALAERSGGDLARMLGIEDWVNENVPILSHPAPEAKVPETDRQTPYRLEADRPGPSVLVIGDSFTRGFFAPMVLRHTGRLAWIHHDGCTLDWGWVAATAPDEVWWMPTERLLPCQVDAPLPDLAAPVAPG